MTNEEIEKRFLFDLEMGVFNSVDSTNKSFRFISNDRQIIEKFVHILNLLSYKFTGNNVPYGMQTVYVNTNKTYELWNSNYTGKENDSNFIPEYIKEYQI